MTHSNGTPSSPVTVAIVGPTASGKTSLSLDLAEALGGEIVNTDAMQVYRGMDIGTAKVPLAERRGIAHHLLDTHDVTEPATVAAFQGWARTVIAELQNRGVTPVLVGGSALYIRAILDEFEFQATDPETRARLEAELAEVGSQALHGRLAVLDPRTAATLAPDNGRRIVRALEVIELTGEPYSPALPQLEYVDPRTVQIGVDIDRPTLDARIEQRVHHMYDAGLIDEVARLLDEGLADGRTASRAIGYREARLVLAGELTIDEARQRTIFATRRYSRKQMGWWRKDPRIEWLPYDADDLVERARALVAAR
ncbi:MAG: tRNA (adenosine(37)-N6)-dimethylallyltransferase MiaA [Nocardioides sp.]